MRGFFIFIFCLALPLLSACQAPPEPQTVTKPDTAPVSMTLANTQADTRAIGTALKDSAGKIMAGVQAARELARGGLTAAAVDALMRAMDGLILEGARVQAQGEAVDPGLTRQLEAAKAQIVTLQGQYDRATAEHARKVAELEARNAQTEKKLAEQEKETERVRSLTRYLPCLFGGFVLGAGLILIKCYPPFAEWPAEPGIALGGSCALGIAWVFLVTYFPVQTAIITASIIGVGTLGALVMVGAHVYRVNKVATAVKKSRSDSSTYVAPDKIWGNSTKKV